MGEVATQRRLFEQLEECAGSGDFTSLLAELEAGADRAATAADAEASRAIVRRYFEMWNTGDRAEADAVLGPTYFDHARPSVVGPAAVRSLVRRFRRDNPGAEMAAEIVAVRAGYVLVERAIRWGARAAVEPWGVALFRVAGGQLVEQWGSFPEARRAGGSQERNVALRAYF
jgi:predicted SnoaL-like aldol condensation-catalyzing enzyme